MSNYTNSVRNTVETEAASAAFEGGVGTYSNMAMALSQLNEVDIEIEKLMLSLQSVATDYHEDMLELRSALETKNIYGVMGVLRPIVARYFDEPA